MANRSHRHGQARDRERSAAASFALHLVKPVQQASNVDALEQLSFFEPASNFCFEQAKALRAPTPRRL